LTCSRRRRPGSVMRVTRLVSRYFGAARPDPMPASTAVGWLTARGVRCHARIGLLARRLGSGTLPRTHVPAPALAEIVSSPPAAAIRLCID